MTAISHSTSKSEDAHKLGADNFVVTGEKGFHENLRHNFDLIISTRARTANFPLEELFS